jgi:hypothetical protein
MKTISKTDPEVRDSPTYWFVILEAARKHNDFRRAAEA